MNFSIYSINILLQVYTDCQCVVFAGNNATHGKAYDGACAIDCYSQFVLFVVIVCFTNFIGGTARTSCFLIQIRCVEERDKAVSLGLGTMFISLFALVPAPIVFGYMLGNSIFRNSITFYFYELFPQSYNFSDTTCIYWSTTCDVKGNCWLYDNARLRTVMNSTAVAFVTLGTLMDARTWFYLKDLKVFDNNDETDDETIEEESN